MRVVALVMAGGKGSRMALNVEKPLLRVGGRSMIEHTLSALKNARMIGEIVVAVTKYTPETAKFAGKFQVQVVETPGEDYVSDMQYAVRKLNLNEVLVISADLPLVTGEIVDEIVERYWCCKKPALAVMVPIEMIDKLDLRRDFTIEERTMDLEPAGINVIDGRRIDEGELEEERFVMNVEEVAINVNTPEEVGIAERLFTERLSGGTSHSKRS